MRAPNVVDVEINGFNNIEENGMSNKETAIELKSSLGLQHEPVAMTIVDAKPESVGAIAGKYPSSCSLWRVAEQRVFYASADDHAGCAIGAHVMGFPLSPTTTNELMAAVSMMDEVGYLNKAEVVNIPQVKKPGVGIIYGPLARFTWAPSVVLMWVNATQAMLLEEALKTTTWKGASSDVQAIFGRPACGALASAVNSGASSFSLGCAGMRTFTEIDPSLSLVAVPGSALADCMRDLQAIKAANDKMLSHYRAHKSALA
jgi:uncharacterized protein (DUF169 family)